MKSYRCPWTTCRYHSVRIKVEQHGDCNFLAVTGKTKLGSMTEEQRKAYMAREIRCPCYEQGEKTRIRKTHKDIFPPVPKTEEPEIQVKHRKDMSKRRELYMQGYNDHEIARMLGLNPNAICWWRKRERLPANAGQGFPKKWR